jgi:ATP synthase subunit 6
MWLTPSRLSLINFLPIKFMWDQLRRTNSFFLKGFSSILVPLFLSLIILNLLGLIPYIFRITRHLSFTLVLGLPLWLSLIVSGILYNPPFWAASLLPGGAPSWLNPFLVLIETTRISVRPITLSFRLAANITAGHIVLTLIGLYLTYRIFSMGSLISIFILLIQIGYIIFEIGICLIQAFIFCLLLSLYSDDHPH